MSEVSPALVQHGISITVNQLQLAILDHLFYSFCPSSMATLTSTYLPSSIELVSRRDDLAALESVALVALELFPQVNHDPKPRVTCNVLELRSQTRYTP